MTKEQNKLSNTIKKILGKRYYTIKKDFINLSVGQFLYPKGKDSYKIKKDD